MCHKMTKVVLVSKANKITTNCSKLFHSYKNKVLMKYMQFLHFYSFSACAILRSSIISSSSLVQ